MSKIDELKKLFNDRDNGSSATYEYSCDHFPEDMNELRTSWEDLKELADEMRWFIGDLRRVIFSDDTDAEEPVCDPVKGEQFVSMAQARRVCWNRKKQVDELKQVNQDLRKELEEKKLTIYAYTSKMDSMQREIDFLEKESESVTRA